MQQQHATPEAAPAPSPDLADAVGADAQDLYGNAALAAAPGLAALPSLGDLWDLLPSFGETPEEAAQREQQEFLGQAWQPLADFDTGTGGVFDVRLVGSSLTITLKVGYDFVSGDPANAPPGVTPAEMEWTPQEQAAFRTDFSSVVSGTWSNAHQIRSTRPLWTTVVDVNVVVIEDDRDPHFKITVAKYPEDAGDGPASVCDGGTHHQGGVCDPNAPGAEEGTALLDSRDTSETRVRNGGQATIGVWFERSETALDANDRASLTAPATDLLANPGWSVELRGHSSADGDATRNLEIARARTDAVEAELLGSGVTPDQILVDNRGEKDKTGNDPGDRRVDVQLLDVQNQVTAAHEAGHMFGLSDEYLGPGEAPGTAFDPEYRKLIRDNAEVPAGGLPRKGEADSIMSNGMEVESWHYAPFVAALKAITGSQEWTV